MSEWDWELTDTARRDFDDSTSTAEDVSLASLTKSSPTSGASHLPTSNRSRAHHIKSSVSAPSDLAVVPTAATRFSTSSGLASEATMRTAAMTTN